MSIDKDLIKSEADKFGISLSAEALDKFTALYLLVIEKNKLFNLTAILDDYGFTVKHFIDSLTAAPFIAPKSSVCDVGSGAGFPAVPLAVALPDVSVTALDSTAKKTSFINEAAHSLNIGNLSALTGRAEESDILFGKFDYVTARAVSSLSILLELCSPLLKVGGTIIAYKTDLSELDPCENALKKLGLSFSYHKSFTLPDGSGRTLLFFKKNIPTPKPFPRNYSSIKKKPL